MIKLNESIKLDPIEIWLFDSNKKEIGKTDGIIDISFLPKFRAVVKGEIESQAVKTLKMSLILNT